jgi:hypothetical protein
MAAGVMPAADRFGSFHRYHEPLGGAQVAGSSPAMTELKP